MRQIKAIKHKYAAAPMFESGIAYVWCQIFNVYIIFTAWHRYFIVLPVLVYTLTTEKNWLRYEGTSTFVYMTITKNLLDQSEYS